MTVMARQRWRETVRVAADVALLGIVVTAAALPVVTAGAAVAAGSAAMRHFLVYDEWPGPAACWRTFRRALLPGFVAVVGAAVVLLVLLLNLAALRRGIVPGGTPVAGVTVVLMAAGAGYAGLVVVLLGAGHGWRAAARTAAAEVSARPRALPAATGVVGIAALLAAMVHPVLTPVLVGCVLFALHVTNRNTT